ncbi:MAG: hypothetical protein ABIK09_11995, partial [Pseudomonadota bacterium]
DDDDDDDDVHGNVHGATDLCFIEPELRGDVGRWSDVRAAQQFKLTHCPGGSAVGPRATDR